MGRRAATLHRRPFFCLLKDAGKVGVPIFHQLVGHLPAVLGGDILQNGGGKTLSGRGEDIPGRLWDLFCRFGPVDKGDDMSPCAGCSGPEGSFCHAASRVIWRPPADGIGSIGIGEGRRGGRASRYAQNT